MGDTIGSAAPTRQLASCPSYLATSRQCLGCCRRGRSAITTAQSGSVLIAIMCMSSTRSSSSSASQHQQHHQQGQPTNHSLSI